jgi:signal peptidase I
MPVRRLKSFAELVAIVAVALFFALAIQALAVKPYLIPTPSMVPTLAVGQRVLVNRLSHHLGADPKLGDITVFTPPAGADDDRCGLPGEGPGYDGPASHRSCSRPTPTQSHETYVKRIVGLPGDTIAVRDGHVVRNGHMTREPFTAPCGDAAECNLDAITVPPDQYFLMGDNRGASNDSRYWGPVPRKWIIGKAIVTYWPLGRIGTP